MMYVRSMLAIGVGALITGPTPTPPAPKVYDASMPRDDQMALAMSAAPAEVSSHATVFVLGPQGYVKAREGTNGFTCFVYRSFVNPTETAVGPMCFDAEGGRTEVPMYFHGEEMRSAGKSEAEIKADRDSGYKSGRFTHPTKFGILYMMSTENRLGPTKDNKTVHVPPHIMLYAPNMTPQDLGFASQPQLPYMGLSQPGEPGNLLVVVPQNSDDDSHKH